MSQTNTNSQESNKLFAEKKTTNQDQSLFYGELINYASVKSENAITEDFA
jgi:hypothetical protein